VTDPAATPSPVAHVSSHFRPDIEGLRAVAVLAVLLFHVGIPGFSGGFVGVDSFNVISGFLITGLLFREAARTGRIDLADFYSRRFRRILPASLLVIAVTLGAAYLILSPLRFQDVAGDAAASSLYAENIRLARSGTDYLAAMSTPSPLQHYWSLGVEEQFYLIWPALILLGLRFLSLSRARWLLVAVLAGSFALSLVVTDLSAPDAFFLLPTRAWQLAAGGLIAVGVLRLPAQSSPRWRGLVGAAGLALLGYAVVSFNESTPYPGMAAVVPTLGTMLVILAGAGRGSVVASGLGTRGPRFIGGISYSLYLWHWPLLILMPIALADDGLPLRVTCGLAAIGLAIVSTHVVEAPFRDGRIRLPRPSRTVAVGLATSLALAVAALGAGDVLPDPRQVVAGSIDHRTAGVTRTPPPHPTRRPGATPWTAAPVGSAGTPGIAGQTKPATPGSPDLPAVRLSGPVGDLSESLRQALDDLPVSYADGCHVDQDATKTPEDCYYGDPHATQTVVLYGDSHAAQWQPALDRLGWARGWRILELTKSACTPVLIPVYLNAKKREYRECADWQASAVARIADEHPILIVVQGTRGRDIMQGHRVVSSDEVPDLWQRALVSTLRVLRETGAAAVLIADTPHLPVDPLDCLSRHHDTVEDCTFPIAQAVDFANADLERAAAAQAGASLLSMNDLLCPNGVCATIMGDVPMYRDQHHLTATASDMLGDSLGYRLDLLGIPPGPAVPLASAKGTAGAAGVQVMSDGALLPRDLVPH
jgi:peptidoglycan/LPS O-acetylase OafA/YrhL